MESLSPDQSNQSAAGVAATLTHGQCDMKLMRKHVVNRLLPYCTVVCQHLGYTTTGLKGDDKKKLIAVLEDWITTGRTKTWPVFIGILSNISELSMVTSEICGELKKAGVHFGGANQSAAGVVATPTQSQCNIKIMLKYVVNKLAPYWTMVCHHLGYSATERDGFRRENNRKSLTAVLEDWISTGQKEGRPKTWAMFFEMLSDVNELSAVTSEICDSLAKAGVPIVPPILRSHDSSPRQQYPQFRPAMVQDDTSSLTCVADAPNKPSSGQSPPASSEVPLDMKTMYKHVVSKLSPYWTTVGDYLEYSVVERNSFRGANNNKSLIALLENWISTDNGREPKTWSTFIIVLKELDQDQCISVGTEICASLETEVLSLSAQHKAPARSASYSAPSGHHNDEHKKIRALSYPRATNLPTGAYHEQAKDDVKRRLQYDDVSRVPITEEKAEQRLQEPRSGQPYATSHQLPHGQRFASIHPSAVRSPSPTNATPHQPSYCQRYPGTAAPSTTGTRPPPGHHLPPASMPHYSHVPSQPSSGEQHQYHPSQNYRSGSPHGYPSVKPSQGYQSPQDYRSMNPSQGYSSMNPSQGHPSMNLYSLQHPRYRSFHPRARLHAAQGPPVAHTQYQPARSTGPQPSLRQQTPQQGPHLQQQMQPVYTQGRGEQQRYGPHQVQGSQQLSSQTIEQQQRHYNQPSSMRGQYIHAYGQTLEQQYSLQTHQGQYTTLPAQQYQQRPQSHGQTVEQQHSIQAQHNIQQRHLPAQQEQHYQGKSHGQTMEKQINKQPKSTQPQMTSMQHHGMVDNTLTEQHQPFPQEETLREEERGQGYFNEAVTTMADPVSCVGDKEQLALQDQLAQGVIDPRCDHTDYHNTSHDTTRSPTCVTMTMTTPTMSTVTSNTSVMSTTARGSRIVDDASLITTTPVASPTVTSRTSFTSGSAAGLTGLNTTATTKTSGRQHFNVGFAPSHTAATHSNTPSTPQLQVNSNTIQTNSNGVEQTTNQSTVNATASSATAVPTVPAPFNWKKGKMLGRGAFGEVFLCIDEDSDRQLAVKEVWIDPNFSSETRQAVESLEREIQLLQNMKHDRIVQYYGTERTVTSVRIFMEYMPGGSLYHHIDQYGVLKEHTASKYTKQLLEGVEYLHNKKIVHRDIKGANILMDCNGHVKIADFGASKLLRSIYLSSRAHKKRNNSHKSVAGTAYWMAPEVIKGETVNYKADIWSIGCTVVEMFTRHPPNHQFEPFPAMYRIATEPMSVDLPEECSENAHDFLFQCFTRDITDRPGASVLLEHRFVKTVVRTSYSTTQEPTATTSSPSSSQVTSSTETVTHTTDTQVTTDGGSRAVQPTAASNHPSSSDSNDDDTVDDDPTDGNDAAAMTDDIDLIKQSLAKVKPPSVQVEQQQQQQQQATSSRNVHSDNQTEPQSEATAMPSPTTMPTSTTATTTTNIPTTAGRNGTERIAPDNLQLKQTPQVPTTNGSNTNSSGSASNVQDNSTPSKSLPERTISNTCMKDNALWKKQQQHMQTASHAFVSNLFGNFPVSSETTPAPKGNVVVQMIVMQDSNVIFSPTGPSSLPIIDHREIGHNSLEPFAYDICNSVNISTILTLLMTHGLITRIDQDYFMNPVYTDMEKQNRLTCLVVSLNEECADKFLDCLSQSAVDYAPHDTLLKKIQSGRKKKESH